MTEKASSVSMLRSARGDDAVKLVCQLRAIRGLVSAPRKAAPTMRQRVTWAQVARLQRAVSNLRRKTQLQERFSAETRLLLVSQLIAEHEGAKL